MGWWPQLGQARGAIVFVLLAELLVRLGAAPLLARAPPRRRALGPAHSQRAGGVLEDAAKGLGAVVRFLRGGNAEVDEVARLSRPYRAMRALAWVSALALEATSEVP